MFSYMIHTISDMKRSTIIPLLLTAYLGFMAWIGRDEFIRGNYLYYFGIIGITLVCIILLRIFLLKREKLRQKHNGDNNLQQ